MTTSDLDAEDLMDYQDVFAEEPVGSYDLAFDISPELLFEETKSIVDLLPIVGSKEELNAKKAPEIIAETLQALPSEKREQIIRQIYGIPSPSPSTSHVTNVSTALVNEDNEHFLNGKLEEMEKEINRLKKSSSWNLRLAAIELAETQNLAYVQSRRFRLKFLRVAHFDVKAAAIRFVKFFDLKLEVFGPNALARDIAFDDLTKEDKVMLKKGYMQRFPVRDRAGRAVCCMIQNGQLEDSPESMVRQFFYIHGTTDEESDKKGSIMLFFKKNNGRFKNNTRPYGGFPFCMRAFNEFPLRVDAFHKFVIKEPSLVHRIIDFAVGIMNPEIVARSKIHYGSHKEWMDVLMSFGVPEEAVPLTSSFKVKLKNHQDFLAMKMKADEMLAADPSLMPESLVLLPSKKDVLLGKGKPIQFSVGNLRLMTIIDGYLLSYNSKSSNIEKTALTVQIVRIMKASGVRFLSKEKTGVWTDVPDDVARDKVSHMFRYQRRKSDSSSSSTGTTKGVVRDIVPTSITNSPDLVSKKQRNIH